MILFDDFNQFNNLIRVNIKTASFNKLPSAFNSHMGGSTFLISCISLILINILIDFSLIY